jgi:hypothetical protein
MMNNKQKTNWWIDIFLLLSFLVTFFMDITGLIAHQWIGIVSFGLAGLHLLLHRKWVKSVSKRLFRKRSGKERGYFAVDAIILLGFSVIILSGVAMSTWLNLTLTHYDLWRQVHIVSSIATLVFVLLKLVFHLSWLQQTMQKLIRRRTQMQPQPVFVEAANEKNKRVGRREFLISLGVVSTASIIALATASRSLAESLNLPETSESGATPTPATETATTTPQTTETASATVEPTSTAASPTQAATQPVATTTPDVESSCTVRCQGGCSYPGHCRRYSDANNNGLCDLGECL